MNTAMAESDRTYLQTPEQWTRFLSALVHELRTPLASLRMLSELLAEAPPRAASATQEKRYADNIRKWFRTSRTLVGDVAELAQLLAGRAQLRPEKVALEELVEQCRRSCARGPGSAGSLSRTPWTPPCPGASAPTRIACGKP